MPKIFVVGLGLLFATIIMLAGALPFFHWWLTATSQHAFVSAFATFAPAGQQAGFASLGMVVFTLGSVGLGLCASALFIVASEMVAEVAWTLIRAVSDGFKRRADRVLDRTLLSPTFDSAPGCGCRTPGGSRQPNEQPASQGS